VDSSVYCLPADLLGEGADRVVGTVRDRAGVFPRGAKSPAG
jgi:hypothetical protein